VRHPRHGRRAGRPHRQKGPRARGLGAPRRRHKRGARQEGHPDDRRAPPRHRVAPGLPGPRLLRALGLRHGEAPRREGHPHERRDRREGRGDTPPLGERV
ncbi:MAG: Nitrile hydratase beta subunit, partial [uncultured Rubrobacteraceae bacterium]